LSITGGVSGFGGGGGAGGSFVLNVILEYSACVLILGVHVSCATK